MDAGGSQVKIPCVVACERRGNGTVAARDCVQRQSILVSGNSMVWLRVHATSRAGLLLARYAALRIDAVADSRCPVFGTGLI